MSSGQDRLGLRNRTGLKVAVGWRRFCCRLMSSRYRVFFIKGTSGRASPLFVWPLRYDVAGWCEALLPSRPTAGLARTTRPKPHMAMLITQVRFTGVSLTSIQPHPSHCTSFIVTFHTFNVSGCFAVLSALSFVKNNLTNQDVYRSLFSSRRCRSKMYPQRNSE